MKSRFSIILSAFFFVAASVLGGEQDPMVGGAAMYPDKNIVENAVNSADHTTLVAAVKVALRKASGGNRR